MLTWLLVAFAIGLAYTLFSITGFGVAMIAVPILVQVLPLQDIVPLLLLLDLVVTPMVGLGNRSKVATRELARLLPFLFVGILIGTLVLASFKPKVLLLVFGVFVIVMAVRGLAGVNRPHRDIATAWVAPAGLVGGVFASIFGTGGPIYALYLSRRLPTMDVFRATISVVILFSTLARLVTFWQAGLLAREGLIGRAAFALPFCLGGLYLGRRLRQRLPEATVRKGLYWMLIISGAGVLVRAMAA